MAADGRPSRSAQGWTKAVLAGHAAVERKLNIDAPVLVLLSGRTRIQAEWTAELMRVDAVIDVEQTARRALGLGRRTAVFRYPGALHDVFLSRRDRPAAGLPGRGHLVGFLSGLSGFTARLC